MTREVRTDHLIQIYTYFRIPEPAGRTFAELDLLFERGVSARKFATTDVDVFGESVEGGVVSTYENDIVDGSAHEGNVSLSHKI